MHTPFSHLSVLGLTLLLSADVHGAAFNVHKRDLVVNNALPAKWSYSGCFTDNTNPRTLHADGYADDSMTESSCISFCSGKGYAYAGIEYGRECYCDNRILDTGVQKDESECSFPCPGSSTEPCGAGNRMSIFTNGKGLSTGPVVNPGFDNWKSLGCYTDTVSERTLQFGVNVDGINSASRCASTCQQAGYTYAGMEYGAECYCGSSLRCPSAPTIASACNMACNGNATEYCGGPNAMNVYQLGNDPINACGVTSSSTSTSSAAAPTATTGILCPSSNNTIYTDATGQKYTTYCGFDYDGGYIQIGDVASYELCLQQCDTVDACGAVAWTGGDGRGFCYLKEANRGLVPNANVMVAIRIPNVVSSSSSSLVSSSSSDSSSISSTAVSSAPSVSSSSSATITAPPSVITPSTTKGLGCPNPTPTALVFGDNVYEYEWCMAYMGYDSVNFSPGSFEGCAKACALGDCVAFNYGDAQNCRTMNKVSTVTTSFYNWKAYSLVGVTPVTAYSFPTTTPTPTTSKGLGCASPTPTAFTISSKVYNYEWCMAYMNPGGMNFSPGSFEGCAAACALGDCVAFNYGDAQNCRTINRVESVTEPFYGWKAYSLVGVTPVSAASPTSSAVSTLQTISVTIISTTVSTSSSTGVSTTSSSSSLTPSPSVTLGPFGTNACPNPTPVSFTISSKLYNYNFCMAYMAPGSQNFGPGSLEGCAKACADGNCLAFNYGYPDNCRTMGRVDAITAPYYGWSAYQFIGTAPLPTTTSTPTPSPSPTITANPYGANACPNPTPTSFTVSNTLYRYNFCMAYMAPGSQNFSPGSLQACAAACKGDCVAFNYGDPQNCRTMNRVNAITAPFYGWSAYQLIGATPLPTAV